jgi:hypothetical protein
MVKYLHLFFLVFVIFISVDTSKVSAQTTRNPVIEFCTGTWCPWCACGDYTIETLLETYPNLIPVAYHGPAGYDPFSNFEGNEIINLMGYTGYPTATVDRASGLGDYTTWTGKVTSRVNVPSTVQVSISQSSFNETTRQFDATINVTPLQDLTGQYKYNMILTEDSLIYDQANNNVCVTGGPGWVHYWVVRAMMNTAAGENLNSGSTWNTGETITKTISYNVSANFYADRCRIITFVYKQSTPLYLAEVQQGQKWNLTETIVPVELTSFTSGVIGTDVVLKWGTSTETNNKGFEIQREINDNFITIGFINGSGTSTESHTYTYTDKNLDPGTYTYRLNQVDFDGTSKASEAITVVVERPVNFSLEQNYPNPFNPSTQINYSIAVRGNVNLIVYDLLGRKVQTLVNEVKEPGSYKVNFDASNLPSGIYAYRIQSGNFIQTKKMMLLK